MLQLRNNLHFPMYFLFQLEIDFNSFNSILKIIAIYAR